MRKMPYGQALNYRLSSTTPEQRINPKTDQNFIVSNVTRFGNRNHHPGLFELIGESPMNPRKKDERCA
jgi:hypothetical protein